MPSLNLFQIAARGVNVVTAPTHLTVNEVTAAQNAEVVPAQGEGGVDQRPGMTRMNSVVLAGEVLVAHDVPADQLTDHTPTLYAGMYTGSTHNWRTSTNGTTWSDADTPAKPFSNNANIALPEKNIPKACTIGRKMYFVDGASPIQLHQFDGTTDNTLSVVPPAVSGTTLTTPAAPSITYEGYNPGATTYTYKAVAKFGGSNSAASTAVTTATGAASLNTTTDYIGLTLSGSPVAGANAYDIYRTAGGGSTGKIGSVPITGGAFTTGNGSAVSGQPLILTVSPTDAGGLTTVNASVTGGVTTIVYKLVPKYGSNYGAAVTLPSITNMHLPFSNTDFIAIDPVGVPTMPAGATSLDVYRTSGGPSQGLIGTITITGGVYTTGNGSGLTGYGGTGSRTYVFTDGGLVGDATTPPATGSGFGSLAAFNFADGGLAGDAAAAPSSASGSSAGNALGILDMITDGSSLYLAALDMAAADPTVYGRILQFNPNSNLWSQIGTNFPSASGNGGPSSLIFYDGSLCTGTYIGTTSGNTSYLKALGVPLPAGGFPEVRTTAVSQATCSLAMFNGDLYAGYASLVAGTAAIVAKRTPVATWSTSLTGVATAQYNAYTSLGVYNGRLYAGWTSGGGATAANIKSTPDGITWTAEITLDVAEVPGQMVTFNNKLYVVLGRTGVAYNTKSRILQRDISGTWTAVDDPVDDFAGCIGIVYR